MLKWALAGQSSDYDSNPDCSPNGAEVSRYTFLEYLKFLIKDLKTNGSYVKALNKELEKRHSSLNPASSSHGNLGTIDLTTLEKAKQDFEKEYKGSNWALANDASIPFANDVALWSKVDTLFN